MEYNAGESSEYAVLGTQVEHRTDIAECARLGSPRCVRVRVRGEQTERGGGGSTRCTSMLLNTCVNEQTKFINAAFTLILVHFIQVYKICS